MALARAAVACGVRAKTLGGAKKETNLNGMPPAFPTDSPKAFSAAGVIFIPNGTDSSGGKEVAIVSGIGAGVFRGAVSIFGLSVLLSSILASSALTWAAAT